MSFKINDRVTYNSLFGTVVHGYISGCPYAEARQVYLVVEDGGIDATRIHESYLEHESTLVELSRVLDEQI